MSDIEKKAKESWKKQIDPDTTEFECFFHYTDDLLFSAGFQKGYELAKQEQNKMIKKEDIIKVNKIKVIEDGEYLVDKKYVKDIQISFQDNSTTMKIFIDTKEEK